MIKVATTSLPAVNRPNADRWNTARSRQQIIKGGENKSHLTTTGSAWQFYIVMPTRLVLIICAPKSCVPVA